MDITKIFKKECVDYEFNVIYDDDHNIKECLKNIKFIIEEKIGPVNVRCDWNLKKSNDSTETYGQFTTIKEWQHQLRKRFKDHPCADIHIVSLS